MTKFRLYALTLAFYMVAATLIVYAFGYTRNSGPFNASIGLLRFAIRDVLGGWWMVLYAAPSFLIGSWVSAKYQKTPTSDVILRKRLAYVFLGCIAWFNLGMAFMGILTMTAVLSILSLVFTRRASKIFADQYTEVTAPEGSAPTKSFKETILGLPRQLDKRLDKFFGVGSEATGTPVPPPTSPTTPATPTSPTSP